MNTDTCIIQLGYCVWIKDRRGQSTPVADSIAFANMDDDTFTGMYDRACDLLCEIIPHVTDANVAQVLAEFAGIGALMEQNDG